jgi:hypothetical protein
MQYFWRHPLAEQVREEGRAQGLKIGLKQGRVQARVEIIPLILEARSIPVPDEVRARVEACTDLDQLEVWARRALQVTDAADLFVDE